MITENAGKKILIIEDEHLLGETLFNKLREQGYEVFWELDGEKGLHKMRGVKPDLVLLDIVMPIKDGYQVLEEASKDEALKKIPIVIISNSGQPVELTRILSLGAKDYIIKAQFTPNEVIEKVRKHLTGTSTESRANDQKSSIKVLLVEDDTFLFSLVAERLVKEGYSIATAKDGVEALAAFETMTPDLLILDIIMPGMNGFEVLKKVKGDPKNKDLAVIIFSNLGQDHEIAEAKTLGADEFLVKAQFSLKEVMEKINTLLKKRGKL